MKKYPVPAPLFLIAFGYLLGGINFHIGLGYLFPQTSPLSQSTQLLPLPVSPFLSIAPLFATIALMMILFYGGLEVRITSFFKEIPRILIQVNLYVLLGMFSIAALAILVFHWNVPTALLLGSIIGGETTAAVAVPLTKLVNMSEQTKTFLVLESTINSIYSIVFFFAFLHLIEGQSLGVFGILESIGVAVLAGTVTGVGFAYLWKVLAPHIAEFEFSFVLILIFVLLAYLISNYFGGGLVSSLVFGLLAIRSKTTRTTEPDYLNRIQFEITFILKTFFFVLMGLLLTEIPSTIIHSTLLYGGLFTALLFVIRLGATRVSTMRSVISSERNIMLFAMAQGLTPAVLAVSTLTFGIPEAPIIVAITLAVILYTNIIAIGAPLAARYRLSSSQGLYS
jgi:potassium/hydrogen antiporter